MPLTLADRLALSDLVHRYAAAVDDRRFDDVVELFTSTAELVLPDPPRALTPVRTEHGHDGVRASMAALSGVARTQHEIVGEVYTDDPAHVSGRVTCVAHHWTRGTDATEVTDLVWHLRYDDDYVSTPAGWRIQRRALTLNAIETRPVRRLRD
ncbi:MAG: nuclear transport factor 2 family protein [Mycobacterium sp.]|nr:nuclear transport factor 2 family protein [Mycobacterium sp.]